MCVIMLHKTPQKIWSAITHPLQIQHISLYLLALPSLEISSSSLFNPLFHLFSLCFFPGGHIFSPFLSSPFPWARVALNNSKFGLIYKSTCSAQTFQSHSSVWQLIKAKEQHGSLISNDMPLSPNWCTRSAQCVPNCTPVSRLCWMILDDVSLPMLSFLKQKMY